MDPEDDDDTITCPVCCEGGCSDALWVCCDVCDTWYYVECTDISPDDYEDLGSIEWCCFVCIKAHLKPAFFALSTFCSCLVVNVFALFCFIN